MITADHVLFTRSKHSRSWKTQTVWTFNAADRRKKRGRSNCHVTTKQSVNSFSCEDRGPYKLKVLNFRRFLFLCRSASVDGGHIPLLKCIVFVYVQYSVWFEASPYCSVSWLLCAWWWTACMHYTGKHLSHNMFLTDYNVMLLGQCRKKQASS